MKQISIWLNSIGDVENALSRESFYKFVIETFFSIPPYNWITTIIFTYLQFHSFLGLVFTDVFLIAISLILANLVQQNSNLLKKRQETSKSVSKI